MSGRSEAKLFLKYSMRLNKHKYLISCPIYLPIARRKFSINTSVFLISEE